MSAEPRKTRIAVVVGDEDLLALLLTLLASDSLELLAASSGRAGLELLQSQKPQLLLLDLALPDMNGWEFFIQIQRENGSQAHGASLSMPVIILANQASRVDRSFGLQVAQVHDFLIKPFLPSQLRRSVAAALEERTAAQYRHAIEHCAA
jgi:two-component system phosphate regulon response regulator PhoB